MASAESHWLVKSEPGKYGWADLVKDGKTRWDGIRNAQARNNLKDCYKWNTWPGIVDPEYGISKLIF